jgi:hypothetical protein
LTCFSGSAGASCWSATTCCAHHSRHDSCSRRAHAVTSQQAVRLWHMESNECQALLLPAAHPALHAVSSAGVPATRPVAMVATSVGWRRRRTGWCLHLAADTLCGVRPGETLPLPPPLSSNAPHVSLAGCV